MSQTSFYDEIWAFKHPETGLMCIELEDEHWDYIAGTTYLLLCKKMNLDPEGETPLVDMMMENDGWISHAKNLGVIVKRTRKEAIAWREEQQAIWDLEDDTASAIFDPLTKDALTT
jgi:hypothetical protein